MLLVNVSCKTSRDHKKTYVRVSLCRLVLRNFRFKTEKVWKYSVNNGLEAKSPMAVNIALWRNMGCARDLLCLFTHSKSQGTLCLHTGNLLRNPTCTKFVALGHLAQSTLTLFWSLISGNWFSYISHSIDCFLKSNLEKSQGLPEPPQLLTSMKTRVWSKYAS